MIETLRKISLHRIAIVSIVVFSIILFLPSINHPFIWDDSAQIVNNNTLRGDLDIRTLLFSPTFDIGGGILAGAFYRPLVSLANYANYQLWGLFPAGFRFIQFAVHAANVVLLYAIVVTLLRRLNTTKAQFIALLTITLFAVHPTNVESLVYIGSIGEVLYTFFILVGFFILLSRQDRINHGVLAISSCFAFLGLLAKETAIVSFPLIFLYFLLFTGTSRRQKNAYIFWSAGTTAAYLLLRLVIAQVPFVMKYGSPISEATLIERLITVPYILVTYIQTLVFPTLMLIYQNTVVRNIADFKFSFYGTALIALLVLFWVLLRKHPNRKLLWFFLAWFLIGLFPVLNFIAIDMTSADRWLYLPSMGFWAFIALYLVSTCSFASRRMRLVVVAAAILYISFLVSRTILREYDWRSDVALFGHDIKYSAQSFELSTNYGSALFDRGEFSRALYYYAEAARLNPGWLTWINLGAVHQRLKHYDKAEEYYLNVMRTYRTPFAYANLASLYIEQKRFLDAQGIINEGKSVFPSYKRLDFLQALLYIKQGRETEARVILEQLLRGDLVNQDIPELLLVLPETS